MKMNLLRVLCAVVAMVTVHPQLAAKDRAKAFDIQRGAEGERIEEWGVTYFGTEEDKPIAKRALAAADKFTAAIDQNRARRAFSLIYVRENNMPSMTESMIENLTNRGLNYGAMKERKKIAIEVMDNYTGSFPDGKYAKITFFVEYDKNPRVIDAVIICMHGRQAGSIVAYHGTK